jgi:hypothetical protein
MNTIKKNIDQFLLGPFYRQFTNTIYKETRDCKSLLDIGCGFNPAMKKITSGMERSVGLDAFVPSIEKAKKINTHSEFIIEDVMTALEKFPDKSFDVVTALDLIEHLEKEKGLWLKQQMERIARKKTIIFTPNGFVIQRPYDNNPWQEHKSGWEYDEMKNYGYTIYGFGGYKKLRGERFAIRYKPRILWKYFSFFTQLFTFNNPDKAFGILCIKQL